MWPILDAADKELDNFIDKHYNRMSCYEEMHGENDEYEKMGDPLDGPC